MPRCTGKEIKYSRFRKSSCTRWEIDYSIFSTLIKSATNFEGKGCKGEVSIFEIAVNLVMRKELFNVYRWNETFESADFWGEKEKYLFQNDVKTFLKKKNKRRISKSEASI